MRRVVQFVEEQSPDAKWLTLFERFWPAYARWYTREGLLARPRYLESVTALRQYMPELIPTYEACVDLAGGGDLAARFLTLYCPGAFTAGCSQMVWPLPTPTLVRNYDYSPTLWEGVVCASSWHQRTIAMMDCLWGALDGINESGVAVSLAFGGRRVVGIGFGMPLILRYVLELATTTKEAIRILHRVPSHMAYNVTVVDARGSQATLLCAPDRPPIVRPDGIATNHQEIVHWPEHARATASVEREQHMRKCLGKASEGADAMSRRFLEPPLYTDLHHMARGTLYTAAYSPRAETATYLWRRTPTVTQRLGAFTECSVDVDFSEP